MVEALRRQPGVNITHEQLPDKDLVIKEYFTLVGNGELTVDENIPFGELD